MTLRRTKVRAQEIREEAEQRAIALANTPIPDVLSACFERQKEFILDPSKRKILCLPRRSGKSATLAYYMIWFALNYPGCNILYLALTKSSAKNVMWRDNIFQIIEKFELDKLFGATWLESKMELSFSNGSTIFLGGGDSSPQAKNRWRGYKFKLSALDEAQNWQQSLSEIIHSVLLPTLADDGGTMIMAGTAGSQMLMHYWWLLNKPESQEKGWTKATWTWRDNPFMKDQMEAHIKELLDANPLRVNTSEYRQEYLGEWVSEDSLRIYKSALHNYIDERPSDAFMKDASIVLSVDLGYRDSTAFCIGAYNNQVSNKLYILESYKRAKLTMHDVVDIIDAYSFKYKLSAKVVDGANSQLVNSIRKHFQISLIDAEKRGKNGHIQLLNSDLIMGNVLILKKHNIDLITEMEQLIWDQRWITIRGKLRENQTLDNHLTDALLYNYWYSKAYLHRDPIEDKRTEEARFRDHMLKVLTRKKPKSIYNNPLYIRKQLKWN